MIKEIKSYFSHSKKDNERKERKEARDKMIKDLSLEFDDFSKTTSFFIDQRKTPRAWISTILRHFIGSYRDSLPIDSSCLFFHVEK